MAVLVDSSVWIAASRPGGEALKLKKLILNGELIFVTRFIQTEVCQWARTENEFRRLWEGFQGFEFLEISNHHWGISAWNFFRIKKKGKTISTIDCLIATLAKENGISLWTLDKGLKETAKIIGFDLYDPSTP